MGRAPRIQEPNILHHVINRGNGRNAIFRAKRDYGAYPDLLERYREKFPVRLYHLVLMTHNTSRPHLP